MNLFIKNVAKFAVIVLLGAVSSAHAAKINTLFNTGVDENGVVLPHGSTGDSHYSLVTVPGGATGTRVITSDGGYPVGPYLGDSAISRWIGPNNDDDLNGPIGNYLYTTAFDLTGFNAATAAIEGRWATDNEGVDILLNGISLGFTSPFEGFRNFENFVINKGFIPGLNTLSFVVNNGGGPTGLRVEFSKGEAEESNSGGVSDVPVPAAIWLFGTGLFSVFGFSSRKKK